jgi:hypothetical protein
VRNCPIKVVAQQKVRCIFIWLTVVSLPLSNEKFMYRNRRTDCKVDDAGQ